MRILAIQNQINYQKTLPKSNSHRVSVVTSQPQTPSPSPSFKGMNGGLSGLATGLTLGIFGFGATLVAGVALPILLVEGVMVGAGAICAKLGSDIEDKIKGEKKEKDE